MGTIASRAFVAPGAVLEGDVTLGDESSVWYNARLVGTAAPVEIGPAANVQDNVVVESRPGQPVVVGEGTSLGHNARVIGAHVEPYALIAIGATVLPGARVRKHAIVGANATVPEGMDVPERALVIGMGRILRQVSDAEVARIKHGTREYQRLSREHAATLGARGERPQEPSPSS